MNVQELLNDLELGDFGYEFENYDGSTYICDAITEIADNYVSIYYSDIMDFIKNNVEEVEDAINEFGWDGCGGDLMKAGQMGEYLKNSKDLYDNLDDSIRNYALKYYVSKVDNLAITEELWDLIDDYCTNVDNNDQLWVVENIIDEYLKNNDF